MTDEQRTADGGVREFGRVPELSTGGSVLGKQQYYGGGRASYGTRVQPRGESIRDHDAGCRGRGRRNDAAGAGRGYVRSGAKSEEIHRREKTKRRNDMKTLVGPSEIENSPNTVTRIERRQRMGQERSKTTGPPIPVPQSKAGGEQTPSANTACSQDDEGHGQHGYTYRGGGKGVVRGSGSRRGGGGVRRTRQPGETLPLAGGRGGEKVAKINAEVVATRSCGKSKSGVNVSATVTSVGATGTMAAGSEHYGDYGFSGDYASPPQQQRRRSRDRREDNDSSALEPRNSLAVGQGRGGGGGRGGRGVGKRQQQDKEGKGREKSSDESGERKSSPMVAVMNAGRGANRRERNPGIGYEAYDEWDSTRGAGGGGHGRGHGRGDGEGVDRLFGRSHSCDNGGDTCGLQENKWRRQHSLQDLHRLGRGGNGCGGNKIRGSGDRRRDLVNRYGDGIGMNECGEDQCERDPHHGRCTNDQDNRYSHRHPEGTNQVDGRYHNHHHHHHRQRRPSDENLVANDRDGPEDKTDHSDVYVQDDGYEEERSGSEDNNDSSSSLGVEDEERWRTRPRERIRHATNHQAHDGMASSEILLPCHEEEGKQPLLGRHPGDGEERSSKGMGEVPDRAEVPGAYAYPSPPRGALPPPSHAVSPPRLRRLAEVREHCREWGWTKGFSFSVAVDVRIVPVLVRVAVRETKCKGLPYSA